MQEVKKRNTTRKFSLLLIGVLCFASMALQAQPVTNVKTPGKLYFSIRAGLNLAQIFGASSQAFNHFGFGGGVKLNYRFHDKFSFEPEVLYSMKGAARFPNPDNGDYYSFSVDIDYIDIPLLFNYHFGGRKVHFSVEFGPYVGFLVRQKAYENQQEINNASTGFNIYDIGLTAGIYYYLPKGFSLNLRYSNSIVPIQPTYGSLPWGVSAISIGQLNSVLNFSLQYTFDFTRKDKTETTPDVKQKKKKEKKQKGDVIDEE